MITFRSTKDYQDKLPKYFVCDTCGKVFAKKKTLHCHEKVCLVNIDIDSTLQSTFKSSFQNLAEEVFVANSFNHTYVFSCSMLQPSALSALQGEICEIPSIMIFDHHKEVNNNDNDDNNGNENDDNNGNDIDNSNNNNICSTNDVSSLPSSSEETAAMLRTTSTSRVKVHRLSQELSEVMISSSLEDDAKVSLVVNAVKKLNLTDKF